MGLRLERRRECEQIKMEHDVALIIGALLDVFSN
jgi:hypothetical protein